MDFCKHERRTVELPPGHPDRRVTAPDHTIVGDANTRMCLACGHFDALVTAGAFGPTRRLSGQWESVSRRAIEFAQTDARAETLATAFERQLRGYLSPATMREVDQRNVAYNVRHGSGVCASHDFCDANMLMAPAFAEVVGREITLPGEAEEDPTLEPQARADVGLWNDAWGLFALRSIARATIEGRSNVRDA